MKVSLKFILFMCTTHSQYYSKALLARPWTAFHTSASPCTENVAHCDAVIAFNGLLQYLFLPFIIVTGGC